MSTFGTPTRSRSPCGSRETPFISGDRIADACVCSRRFSVLLMLLFSRIVVLLSNFLASQEEYKVLM